MNLFQVDDEGRLFISPVIDDWEALAAHGIDVVIDMEGGLDACIPTKPGTRTYSIPLFSQITAIPAGSRLEVTFGSSTAGTPAGPLYLAFPPTGSPTLTVANGVVRLAAMIRPVS